MLEWGWIVAWYVASLVLVALSFPVAFTCCSRLPDRGYALTRILSLVLAGAGTFAFGLLRVPVKLGWPLALLALALISYLLARKQWKELQFFVSSQRKLLITLEAVFLLAFVAFALVRALSPSISGGEKYMDSGIFTAVQRADYLPVQDFWIVGQPLRYYWFGHLFVGLFSKSIGTPPPIGYNLTMALLFALAIQISLSLGFALTKKWHWAAIGVGYAAIFGNVAGAVQLISRSWQQFDFWMPTRVIDGSIAGTINEFPFFSYFFADLHAHVIAFSMVLALYALFLQQFREGITWRNSILPTILLGCIRVTNAWDWPALAALLGLVFAARWWRTECVASLKRYSASFFKHVILPWAIIVGVSFALFFGFPQPQPLSIKIASLHSLLNEWFLVFGALVVLLLGFVVSYYKRLGWIALAISVLVALTTPVWVFVLFLLFLLLLVFFLRKPGDDLAFGIVLASTACLLLIMIELVYVNDWLAHSWQRMNTVFKFGLHVWLLLSMAVPVLVATTWQQTTTKRLALCCCLGMLLLAGLAYPVVVIAQRAHAAQELTLNGWKELEEKHHADWVGISWLASRLGNPVVLEAEADAYTYGSRVSSYTGLPTVVGWNGHLFQHGISWSEILSRRRDVNFMYNSTTNTTTFKATMDLLHKYNVTYVFVGEWEKQLYSAPGLTKFESFPVALEDQGVVIYRVP